MYDNLIDLGTTVVLDAHNLIEGQYVTIANGSAQGEVFIVGKILDGTRIILRPLTFWERFTYRLNQNKSKVIFTLAIVTGIAILGFWIKQ